MPTLQEIFTEADSKLSKRVSLDCSKIEDIITNKLSNFLKFAETRDITYLKNEMAKLNGGDKSLKKDVKENIEPNNLAVPRRTRQRNTSSSNSTFTKPLLVQIKQEKMSMAPSTASSANSTADTNLIKNNAESNDHAEEMPAPTILPTRKRKIKEEVIESVKKPVRTRTKPRKYLDTSHVENNEVRPSEVMIQNQTITMIDITEDKESDNDKKKGKPKKETVGESAIVSETRSTRTKTRQQKKQLEQDKLTEDEEEKSEKTRTKPKRIKKNNGEIEDKKANGKRSNRSMDKDENKSGTQTDYEDAVSNLDPNEVPEVVTLNGNGLHPTLNSTMVIEKPKVVNNNAGAEAKEKDWKTPPKTKSKKEQIKEIFSPYDKTTSLKKKVEAFEKFGATTTKQPESASKIPLREESNRDSVKTKPYTPFSNKFVPKTCSTLKTNRLTPSGQKASMNNESGISLKSMSALKASQAEYREREKRRLEKEKEAQMKKEALLQAQAEEKRRKREEKQLKAQQQREIIQKEKEKQLEIQKLKDEKHKQVIAEKEEKLQKTREEVERKRLLAKQKAKIAKENENKEEKHTTNEERTEYAKTKRVVPQTVPIYMLTKAPLLPTEDCYDSDDEEYRQKRYIKPAWGRDETLKRQLYAQLVIGEKIKNTLFCCQTHSPDLTEIFEAIDPKKLQRTSSAVWKKPPRYTLFSMTSDIQFSEDSEEDV